MKGIRAGLNIIFFISLLLVVSCSDSSWVKCEQCTFADPDNKKNTSKGPDWNVYADAPDEIRFEGSKRGYYYFARKVGTRTKFSFNCQREGKLCTATTAGDNGERSKVYDIEVEMRDGYYRGRLYGSEIWITYVVRN